MVVSLDSCDGPELPTHSGCASSERVRAPPVGPRGAPRRARGGAEPGGLPALFSAQSTEHTSDAI